MSKNQSDTRTTRTIFLCDKDDHRNRDILNYFANQGNYRVLCLDFLI